MNLEGAAGHGKGVSIINKKHKDEGTQGEEILKKVRKEYCKRPCN